MRSRPAGSRPSTPRLLRMVLGLILIAFASASCGGKSSSSGSPTAPTPSASATLTITNITATAETSGGGLVYHVTFTLRETGGQAGATITTVDLAFSDGGTLHVDSPMQTSRIAAGGSLDSKTIDMTDASGRPVARSLTVTVSFSDDGNHTGTVAGNASITPPTQTFRLTGVVTDAATAQAINRAIVSIGTFASVWTNAGGSYSLTGIPGGVEVTLTASASGYAAISQAITLFADRRIDVQLAAPTPPTGTPDVEYRVSGTTTRINHITYTDSTGATAQVGILAPPWSYWFSGAQAGQTLSVSAQNDLSVGCVKVQILKRGVLFQESESCELYGTATASGSF